MNTSADNGTLVLPLRRLADFRVPGPRAFLAAVFLTLLVFFSPPLFFIARYSLTAVNKPVIFGLIVALAILLFHRFTISKTAAQLGFLQLAQAAALLVLPFLHMLFGYGLDARYFSVTFQILAALALFQVLANTNHVRFFATVWVNLHLVIGAFGLLVFVGGIAFNIQPLTTFLDRPYYDFGLAYTNVFYQVGDVKLIRIAGFYDEPGTFAFYMTFSLLIARLFKMPRWKELWLIILGLTSLSMAFFVVTFLWVLFSLNRRTFKYLLLLVLAVAVGLARVDPDVREQAYRVTVDRFNPAASGNRLLRGDTRTEIMIDNYRAFTDAPVIGHGLHYEDYVSEEYSYSFIVNPMAPFATHGVIGTVIINIHVLTLFVLLALSRGLTLRDKSLLFLVLLATLAQRPITVNGLGFLLFIIMMWELLAGNRSRAPSGPEP
jgi:hypothetical protein